MKHIIFLLLICFAFGCKTTRTKTELQVETNAAAKLDVSASTASTEVKKAEVKTIDKSTSQKVTTWEANTKVFSAPDSTGKQHLQSETNAKGKTVEGEQKNVESNKKDSVGSSNKSDVIDKSKINAKAKANEKVDIEEKTAFPFRLVLSIVGVAAGVLAIAFWGFKKYKIL